MKFYSEELKKYFDTQKECEDAEKEFEDQQKKQLKIKEETSIEKKKYAKAVEAADKSLQEEYQKFDDVKKQVFELRKETEKKCNDLLNSARENLVKAQQVKWQAVQEFNEKFGPYTVSYTGEKAKQELRRHLNNADWVNFFYPFFNW